MSDIIHGDCIEEMQEMSENSVDLVLTDPPYFLPSKSYGGSRSDDDAPKRSLADTSVLKGYFDTVFEELDRITKSTGTFYVFSDSESYPVFYRVMYPYCRFVRSLVWDKKQSYTGYTWRRQHELIAWGKREDAEQVPTGDGTVLKVKSVGQDNRVHPAQKPVELLKMLIEKNAEQGDTVFDPFMGSGSTGVAAKELGRDFVGCELDEEYYQMAENRIEKTETQVAKQTNLDYKS